MDISRRGVEDSGVRARKLVAREGPMIQRLTIALPLLVVGGVAGILRFGRRRRLRAADIMQMDEQTFNKRMRRTGMEAQVRDAMTRVDRGSA